MADAAPVTAVEEDEHAILFRETEQMQKNAAMEIEDEEWTQLSAADVDDSKEPKEGSGMVEAVFRDVSALQPSFWSLGFELAETGWLSISIGTASSFAVALVPCVCPPEAAPEPASLTLLQRLVLAVLRRAKSVAHSLHTEHFELARLRLSLAGVGLAIPSVTGTLFMRERACEDGGDPSSTEHAAASVHAAADGTEHEQVQAGLLDRAKAAVGSLFHRKGDAATAAGTAPAAAASAPSLAADVDAGSGPSPPPPPGTVLSNERRPQSELRDGVEDLLDGKADNVRTAADCDPSAVLPAVKGVGIPQGPTAEQLVDLSQRRVSEINSNLNAPSTAAPGSSKAEENCDSRGVEAMLAQVAQAGSAVVDGGRRVFGGRSRSVLQRIVGEMRDLRTALAASGFALKTKAGHRAWLSVIVGTFVGIQISVTPTLDRPDIDISKLFPNLTLLQRTVLRTLRSCNKIAVNLAMRKLRVQQMDFRLSGLGLAIPVASVTFTLCDMTAEEKQKYDLLHLSSTAAKPVAADTAVDETLDEKLAEADSHAAAAAAVSGSLTVAGVGPEKVTGAEVAGAGVEVAGAEPAAEPAAGAEAGGTGKKTESKSRLGFILEGLQGGAQAAKALVVNASAASMRAIHATGSSAQSVMHAATASVTSLYHKIVPRRDESAAVDTVLGHAETASHHMRGLKLELNRPAWLSISLGTSNGFSVSFRPVDAGPDTLTLPVVDSETSGDNKMAQLVVKLMRALHRSHTFASHARRRALTINSYEINAGGVGLGIPFLSASVNIDRDPSLPL